MTSQVHVLVLAAGASTRLGEPKQLVRVGGRPALHTVVAHAVAIAGHAVTVILGAHARDLTHMLLHSPASVVINREWEEGMASSIRRGMAAVPPGCEAVMLVLGDQVAVTADDLRRLVSAWKGESSTIAASVYEGRAGVPAIFPSWCFSELSQLRGDQGARAILQRNMTRLVHVPMPNAAFDLDTPEDLVRLRERFAHKA
ncbi:MAG: nucleotidyltransferase family protein [Steroidobacteraceae bacterium]